MEKMQEIHLPREQKLSEAERDAWALAIFIIGIVQYFCIRHVLKKYFKTNKTSTDKLTLVSVLSTVKRCALDHIQRAIIQSLFMWSYTLLCFSEIMNIQNFILCHVNMNITDQYGRTLLHKFAEKGFSKTVYTLLDKGASVHAIDNFGCTPLHYAARNGHVHIVKMLLDNGASKDAADNVGRTPLHESALKGCMSVAVMFLERGVSPNTVDIYGKSPLHDSAIGNHAEYSQLLIVYGGSLDTSDNFGSTPQEYAYRRFWKYPVHSIRCIAPNIYSAFTHGILWCKVISTADLCKVLTLVAVWMILPAFQIQSMTKVVLFKVLLKLFLLPCSLTCMLGQVYRKMLLTRGSKTTLNRAKNATNDQTLVTHDCEEMKIFINRCIVLYIFPTGYGLFLSIFGVQLKYDLILTLFLHVLSVACTVNQGFEAVPARRLHKPTSEGTQETSAAPTAMNMDGSSLEATQEPPSANTSTRQGSDVTSAVPRTMNMNGLTSETTQGTSSTNNSAQQGSDVTSAVPATINIDGSTSETTQGTSFTNASAQQGIYCPDIHDTESMLRMILQNLACNRPQQSFRDNNEGPPESGGTVIIYLRDLTQKFKQNFHPNNNGSAFPIIRSELYSP